jgi:polar amino acid transport system substrate-binding protein
MVRFYRLLLVVLLAGPASAADLLLYTEENPPLNFSRDGGLDAPLDGFASALVQALIVRSKAQDRVQIEMAPWTRGYSKVKQEANVGLFSTVRTPERESLMRWVGPLMQTRSCFYSRKDAGLQVRSLADAEHEEKIAVPRAWSSYEYLSDHGLNNLYGVTTPDKLLPMLMNNRLRLIVSEEISLPRLLVQQNIAESAVEQQFCFMNKQFYLAFSLQTDAAVVTRWQGNLDAMKRDGSFARAYNDWFPNQPLPASLLPGSAAPVR